MHLCLKILYVKIDLKPKSNFLQFKYKNRNAPCYFVNRCHRRSQKNWHFINLNFMNCHLWIGILSIKVKAGDRTCPPKLLKGFTKLLLVKFKCVHCTEMVCEEWYNNENFYILVHLQNIWSLSNHIYFHLDNFFKIYFLI